MSKVSSGALEFIPLYSVRFIKPFMVDAQKGSLKFKIISTDIEGLTEKETNGHEEDIKIIDSEDEGDSDIFPFSTNT